VTTVTLPLLLDRLADVPRENGSTSLEATASFLADALRAAGLEVSIQRYVAQPWSGRLAGVLVFAAALLFARWILTGRARRAYWLGIAYASLLFLQYGLERPVVGLVVPARQANVIGELTAGSPSQHLILSAHYDSITEASDHVVNGMIDSTHPIVFLLILTAAGAVGAGRAHGWRRGVAWAAAILAMLHGTAVLFEVGAGALRRERSHGAVDDGASCAALVRLADELASGARLERTDVEIVLFSGEELSLQGSMAFVAQRYPVDAPARTFVVNLEGIGQSSHLGVLEKEPYGLWSYAPDPVLRNALEQTYRSLRSEQLLPIGYPARTDASSFLRRGIPALTLVSYVPNQMTRGLHSPADVRRRLDEDAIEDTVAVLAAFVHAIDTHGL
jgi:hypothetical protein